MIDPVSEELARRAQVRWGWRRALLIALGVHVVAGVGLLLGGSSQSRPISLPSVQVRITSVPVSAPKPQGAAAKQEPREPAKAVPPAEPRQAPKAKPRPKPEAKPPSSSVEKPSEKPKPEPSGGTSRVVAPVPPSPTSDDQVPASDAGPAESPLRSQGGGLSLGGNAGPGTEESFPYTYYLNRLLGVIESNWFRPPAPVDTRCRVRCRIDRGGRLLDAGIEEASGVPAFDRAALRAVYASAPYPPLPQGFGGTTLTLHLEFGQ